MTSSTHDWWRHTWIMTSSTVWISTKMIPRVHSKPGKIVLQHRYYWYQRTFPNHEYGVWLDTGCMKRFFVTAVVRATGGPESEVGSCIDQINMYSPPCALNLCISIMSILTTEYRVNSQFSDLSRNQATLPVLRYLLGTASSALRNTLEEGVG